MKIKLKSIRRHTVLLKKLKESFLSVMPVALLISLVCLTPLVNINGSELLTFVISTLLLIAGIALFNLGADLAMSPMGEFIGTGLSKSQKLLILLTVSFIMGVFITVAEPDLSVLASQVGNAINSVALVLSIGIGVGIFLLLGVIKIVFGKDQTALLIFCYMSVFAFAALLLECDRGVFLPLAFDSGGVTTGPITVPFIMALGVGISRSVGGKNSQENSFGLVALCSVGPVLAMLILPLFSEGLVDFESGGYSFGNGIAGIILNTFVKELKDVIVALMLIVFIFAILQITILKISRQRLLRIFSGIVYTLFGLSVFLTAVSIGYMPMGYRIGKELAGCGTAAPVIFAFVTGMATVLAEPAIHVLNHQVEDVTDGSVSRRQMMMALSVGVGISVGLSAIRTVFGFSVLYYLIPGYLLSLMLSFFVPKLYTAIAFDSGGVASGPLTSSFVLPLITGICISLHGEDAVLSNAFGMVAMVAMTPLIAIQVLGFKAVFVKRRRKKIAMKRILLSEDTEVIYFEW